MFDNVKKWIVGNLFSLTSWFATALVVLTWLNNNTQAILDLIPDQYDKKAGYVIAFIIWLLRQITKKPIPGKVPGKVEEWITKPIDTQQTRPPDQPVDYEL